MKASQGVASYKPNSCHTLFTVCSLQFEFACSVTNTTTSPAQACRAAVLGDSSSLLGRPLVWRLEVKQLDYLGDFLGNEVTIIYKLCRVKPIVIIPSTG